MQKKISLSFLRFSRSNFCQFLRVQPNRDPKGIEVVLLILSVAYLRKKKRVGLPDSLEVSLFICSRGSPVGYRVSPIIPLLKASWSHDFPIIHSSSRLQGATHYFTLLTYQMSLVKLREKTNQSCHGLVVPSFLVSNSEASVTKISFC